MRTWVGVGSTSLRFVGMKDKINHIKTNFWDRIVIFNKWKSMWTSMLFGGEKMIFQFAKHSLGKIFHFADTEYWILTSSLLIVFFSLFSQFSPFFFLIFTSKVAIFIWKTWSFFFFSNKRGFCEIKKKNGEWIIVF